MPAFLTRVVIENYKSIAHCDVKLSPLTFLIGPNGAGKSNFLDAVRFVSECLSTSLHAALTSRGGGSHICHYPTRDRSAFGIRVEFDLSSQIKGSYGFKIGVLNEVAGFPSWEILHEECRLSLPNSNWLRIHPGASGARAQVHYDSLHLPEAAAGRLPRNPPLDEKAREACRELYESLKAMQFYAIRPEAMEDVETFAPTRFLEPDGKNLASILSSIRTRAWSVFDRVNDYMKVLLPHLDKVRIESVLFDKGMEGALQNPSWKDFNKVALIFQQVSPGQGAHAFFTSQMSEGTLRTLAILVALLQATVEDVRLPLVGIEDIEAAIHPAALGIIIDAMQEAATSTQVIATSHSPDLLDAGKIPEEAILVAGVDGGETRIGPLSDAGKDMLRRNLYTPGELLRMGQAAPELQPEGTLAPLFDNEANGK